MYRRQSEFDERLRISYSRTEEVETPEQVAHPLVRHALEVAGIDGGIEITSMADIPSVELVSVRRVRIP